MPDYLWSFYLTHPWLLGKELCGALKHGIRNLVVWFPVIWNDRHWNSEFLLKVIRRKITLQEAGLRRNPDYVGADRNLHHMNVCVLLIDRLLADEYTKQGRNKHRKKWGEKRWSFEPNYNKDTGDIDPETCQPFTDWPNAPTKELKSQARKELHDCYAHARMLGWQDVNYLFTLLRKHSMRW